MVITKALCVYTELLKFFCNFDLKIMSKKALKKYLHELSKEQLEEQVLELYTRLKEVKEFYNFVFNPNENKRIEECKFKIQKEYFPLSPQT